MAFKFDFKTVLFAGLLLNGCAPETPDPSHPDKTAGNATASTKDASAAGQADAGASASKDAGKDAGKKDAGSTGSDEGDEPEDDAEDDSIQDDTADETGDDSDESTTPSLDAGKADAGAKADAGGAKADAGGGASSGDACAELTYEKFGKSFLDTYCLSCHMKMKPTFATLAEVVMHKAEIKSEAATGTAMPPKGLKAPTAEERTKLGKWLDCGPK